MSASYGPFATEREARAAALELAGPPEASRWILSEAQRGQLLVRAISEAGIEAGEFDLRIIARLTGFEDAACAVIAGLILRAAGKGESEASQ